MDKGLYAYFVVAGLLAMFVLAWRPLRKQFKAYGVLFSYFLVTVALTAFHDSKSETFAPWVIFLLAIIALLTNRRKPIKERPPTVAWMVVHGLWDQLAKEGLPADEIEKLKKLTPEERARLMAEIMRPVERLRSCGCDKNRVKHIFGTFPGDYVWDDKEHF